MQTTQQDNVGYCSHSFYIILCSLLPLLLIVQHQTKIKIVSLILEKKYFLCASSRPVLLVEEKSLLRLRKIQNGTYKGKTDNKCSNKNIFYVCYIILMLQKAKSWATVSLCFSKRVIVIFLIKMSGTIRQTASLQCYSGHCIQGLPVKIKVSKWECL